jgi:two-component system sensor histidine kinase RpfC
MRMTGFELARDWRRHCDTLGERLRRGELALAARGNWHPAREDSQ